MDAGQLVPDDVIISIITERLAADDCRNGYILDGVPRTIAQGRGPGEGGIRFDAAISIEISDETITERMSGPPCLRDLRGQLPPGGCAPQAGRHLRQVRRQAGPNGKMMNLRP